MLESLIQFSIYRRAVVFAVVALVCALGLYNFTRLPIDAVPDITNVQVVINTPAQGYTPLEVEQRISYVLENAMAGLPALEETRSLSRYGLSQVTVVFTDDTDIYFARQLVNERLNAASGDLPAGIRAEMGPIATGLGEIFMFTVDAEPGAVNPDGSPVTPTDLRTVHDWIIRPQLMRVPGVVEVNPIGGYKREIQISINPVRLMGFGLSQRDLLDAIARNNQNMGAGFIEKSGMQLLIRIPGQADSIAALGDIAIHRSDEASILRLRDVADIVEGKELRGGAATQNGHEVVMSTVFMLIGENSRNVAAAVAEKLDALQSSLPAGVSATAVYDRTTLVDKTLVTVSKNLIEGALLVIVILFVLLRNLRAALITAAVIPIAMLMTITGMVQTRVSANLMSLGALDFGLLVDGAIIIVENCLRRLSLASSDHELTLRERMQLVFESTREVIRPAMFGVFIITVVYLPIFALQGVEGKMFHPMAQTVVMALVCAMLLSITFVPASVALFFKRGIKVSSSAHAEADAKKSVYGRLVAQAINWRAAVIALAVLILLSSAMMASRLGSEFVPNLDEGDIAMHALRIPGTSLTQALELQKVLEAQIAELPEVDKIFAKIGSAEVATDPMPPSVADNFIILKPRDQWPDPSKTKAQLVDELAALVAPVPGNRYEFLQPIQMRFNELLAGVRSELAIKVFGDDFDTLIELGQQIEKAIAEVDGIADIGLEQVSGLPILSIEPNLLGLQLHGVDLVDLQQQVATALGGQAAGLFYEGDRRFDIVLRLPEAQRNDIDALAALPIACPDGDRVPLGELATIKRTIGYNQIYREGGKRRVVVTANVRGRDLGSFVADVQKAVASDVVLPAGYWVNYGGTYEKLQSASERLMIVVPLTLALIIALLLLALGNVKDAVIIFSGVPLALTGGIIALLLRDIPFSISAAVGFIALSGIAILNGLVMVAFIRDLRERGAALKQAIVQGATTRLRPVLSTALVASLGFIPMALNTGIGSEVQRPLATVVIGGIISSTLLTLLVLPALYSLLHSRDAQ